jgi:hypothetical protein
MTEALLCRGPVSIKRTVNDYFYRAGICSTSNAIQQAANTNKTWGNYFHLGHTIKLLTKHVK